MSIGDDIRVGGQVFISQASKLKDDMVVFSGNSNDDQYNKDLSPHSYITSPTYKTRNKHIDIKSKFGMSIKTSQTLQ